MVRDILAESGARRARLLFIFRRDLRLADNTGLLWALAQGEVTPVFIFDPKQRDHPYFSEKGFAFLLGCIRDLEQQLRATGGRLFIYHGASDTVLGQLLDAARRDGRPYTHVVVNRDYTPFSVKRDARLRAVCERHGVRSGLHDAGSRRAADHPTSFNIFGDALLHEPEEVKKGDGTPYTVFTPYWRAASAIPLRAPQTLPSRCSWLAAPLREIAVSTVPSLTIDKPLVLHNGHVLRGGRSEALELLAAACKLRDYATTRDELGVPAGEGTSLLAAHLKFGTVSVREVHRALEHGLGSAHAAPLLRQLFWRDFFTHIAVHFPRVFGASFHERYDKIRWADIARGNGLAHWRAWCEGKTGFPVVDAGMRELIAAGLMHNRARMICASFLVKDLHIDWREGERFFAQHLIDYDPCVNNGSWQWAASTGCDAQPYFRIFNPWLQQQRFDPEGVYVKRWVPELSQLSAGVLHKLESQRPLGLDESVYPRPIVVHKVESERAKAMFAGVR
jgi:deoxyribodipyrimidine photo-lyase